MKTYNELESLGFFEWLSETYNLKDTDMKPEYLDELPLNDIHRTVCNSMAFRWCREKHNLDSSIALVAHGYGFYIHKNRSYTNRGENYGVHITYEQAESECIDKLISLIKEK